MVFLTSEKERKTLPESCGDDQVQILCEIALNTYKGNWIHLIEGL